MCITAGNLIGARVRQIIGARKSQRVEVGVLLGSVVLAVLGLR